MDSLHPATQKRLRGILRRWGAIWGVPGLERLARVRMSERMTRSLGRCNPQTGLITLRSNIPTSRLPRILCHEAAHLAAFRLYGASIRPHGVEWAGLVEQAGFAPSVREYTECLPSRPRSVTPPPYYRYAHRCTVCQSVRWAQRRMTKWRCDECLESGLAGELKITDMSTP